MKSVTPARSEALAQALASRFEGVEHWEWNEVADFVVGEFLLLERRLTALKPLLKLEGATYVTWEHPEPHEALSYVLEAAGVKLETRTEHGHTWKVVVLL